MRTSLHDKAQESIFRYISGPAAAIRAAFFLYGKVNFLTDTRLSVSINHDAVLTAIPGCHGQAFYCRHPDNTGP